MIQTERTFKQMTREEKKNTFSLEIQIVFLFSFSFPLYRYHSTLLFFILSLCRFLFDLNSF